jgi:hypothetical protein
MAFIRQELVRMPDTQGVSTWSALHAWLAAVVTTKRPRCVWPMPRDVRLSLPDAPRIQENRWAVQAAQADLC